MADAARTPQPRHAARVLLLDEHQRILLFRVALNGGLGWIAPGGGREAGETHQQAALREVREETGITDLVLGACVWTRRHVFTLEGTSYDQRERFFVAHAHATEVSATDWTPEQHRFLQSWRWWALPEIAASTDLFVAVNLAELLAPILRGEHPAAPLIVGE